MRGFIRSAPSGALREASAGAVCSIFDGGVRLRPDANRDCAPVETGDNRVRKIVAAFVAIPFIVLLYLTSLVRRQPIVASQRT